MAIFVGQVAAALSTGNAVVTKPAEQTPGVAWEAVKLLHAAGVPEAALQLVHGQGATLGAALVTAPGVAGVVFTGSTQVAKTINSAFRSAGQRCSALRLLCVHESIADKVIERVQGGALDHAQPM